MPGVETKNDSISSGKYRAGLEPCNNIDKLGEEWREKHALEAIFLHNDVVAIEFPGVCLQDLYQSHVISLLPAISSIT